MRELAEEHERDETSPANGDEGATGDGDSGATGAGDGAGDHSHPPEPDPPA
jgi:hypothetical protein